MKKPRIGKQPISYTSSVPYIVGEDHMERHKRRHDAAFDNLDVIREWCLYRGVRFSIRGTDHFHDKAIKLKILMAGDARVAGWCPGKGIAWKSSSAKNTRPIYEKIHDSHQFLKFLDDWWSISPEST